MILVLPVYAFASLTGVTSVSNITETPLTTFSRLDGSAGITTVTIGNSTYGLVTSLHDNSLTIFDITTPSSPTLTTEITDGVTATFDDLAGAYDVTTVVIDSSTYALVASQTDGSLTIIDITTPGSPSETNVIVDGVDVSFLAGASGVTTVVIGSNTYALVTASTDNSLTIFDITTPGTTSEITVIRDGVTATFDDLGNPEQVTTVVIGSNTYALVTASTDNSLTIIDITTPSTPSETAVVRDGVTATFNNLAGASGVTTVVIGSNTYALVTSTTEDTLTIIDITTPGSPTLSSEVSDSDNEKFEIENQFASPATFVLGDQTYAIAAGFDDDGIQIINLSTPTSPTFAFARNDTYGNFTNSELDGTVDVTTVTIDGIIHALVSAFNDFGVQIFSLDTAVSGASAGTFVQSITDKNGLGGNFTDDVMYNVGVNSTNHIFAAMNTPANAIIGFDSSGIFQANVTATNMVPHSVTFDSNDRMIVVSDNSGDADIHIFNSTGIPFTTFDGSNGAGDAFVFPHDVEVDSSDNIYVMDKSLNQMQKYSSVGTFISKIVSGTTGDQHAFVDALGLAVDSTGRIIILDRGSTPDNFQIFSSDGTFVKRITDATGSGGFFSDPHDVEVDSHDRIYVADQLNHRIQVFDSNGDFLTSISAANPVAPTTFNNPEGIVIDSNGRIIVADTFNERIQIFQKLDDPTTTTTPTAVEISAASDSSDSTQEKQESAAAEPDETFSLPEEQYDEVVAESLATPISAPVEVPVTESFEAVAAPEKVDASPEDTSFKRLSKSDDKEDDAKKMGLEYKDGDVRALVILDDDTSDDILNEIKKYANIESENQNLVQINIPIDDLSTLYKIPDITKVQPTSKAIQSSLYSEGYKTIHANIPHELGVQGDGIKIAILDLAFDDTNDEIKNNIVETKSFRHDFDGLKIPLEGFGHESIHGTAVSEIVIDISPNSELFLYTFASEVEFLDAMDYSINKDVDLITMSAGWVNYPTDGSSEMTKKIEQAIDLGIPFVVSAGNYAETHWEGTFIDSNGNGWHEFDGTDEGISVVASESRVERQTPFILYLMWDSPSDTINDFDLTMTDEDGIEVAYSANLQDTDNAINFEYVYFTPEKAGTYSLGVLYGGADDTDAILEIFSPSDKLEYPISEGSVSVPTDAKGIISVGAINYYDSRLEPFSSQGPTNNCISSPSLVAPDAVTTTAYGGSPFFGTSAAAPHVAGMVALMIDKTPQLTPLQILSELTTFSNTEFESYVNLNNMFGSGAADSKFIAELDEIVHVVEVVDGCKSKNYISDFRTGDSDQQSKFAVAGIIAQQGIVMDEPSKIIIPQWIKSSAGWWAEGTMTDDTFVNALEFLIEQEIIDIPKTVNVSEVPKDKEKHEFDVIEETLPIPDWIKNNAKWWSEDTITNDTFIDSIQYLIKQGIIDVN